MRYVQQNGILVPRHAARNRQRGFITCGPAFFGGAASSGGDPYWSDVASLCYYQGSNGSTTITDEVAASSWAAQGTAAISTAQAKFGTASLRLPGTTGSYVSAGTAASYWTNFNNASPWTIEIWLRADAITGSTQTIYDMGGVASGNTGTALAIDSTAKLDFLWAHSVSGGYLSRIQQGLVVANTWTLAEVGYSGGLTGTVYLFQDGALLQSASLPAGVPSRAPSNPPDLGRYNLGNSLYFAGSLGESRWTAGVCRHTSSYTPDTSQWPNHA